MSNEAITWAYQQTAPSPGAKFVLVALADMADEAHSCFPGQAKLAAMTGQGERTVRRQLAELEAAGLVVREHRFGERGHRTSDRYVLQIPTGQIGHRPNRPPAKSTTSQSDHRPDTTSLPANLAVPTGQSGQVTQREPKEEPTDSRPTSTKAQLAASFDAFWRIYPRHVGKRKAELEWERAVKRADVSEILAGARRYRDDPNRAEQFTAHPSTWLHQDRWGDDPLPARLDDKRVEADARVRARQANPLASAL